MSLEHDFSGLQVEEARRLLRRAGYPGTRIENAGGRAELQWLIDGLCEISHRDGLTGLYNARYFRLTLERELDRVARTGDSAALLMIGIDYPLGNGVAIADQSVTDSVMKALATVLSATARPMDVVARYAEDRFAVILSSSKPALARATADRIRERVAATAIEHTRAGVMNMTVSLGIAYAEAWERIRLGRFVAMAEQHLETAKRAGGNRVVMTLIPTAAVSPDERVLLFAPPRKKRNG